DSIISLTLTVASGINNVALSNNISIYPNPTNQLAVISSQLSVNNASIKLINLTGQTVLEKQNQSGNQFTIDLSAQAQGIYFIEVSQQGNVWRGKVVKE
ncbi:MAG: Secretion system C-terminal sorting domain, partial [Bacteroidota bacterium]